MTRLANFGVVLAASLWLSGAGPEVYAQSTTQSSPAPCTVIPQPDPCGSKPSDKKAPTQKFPFPGETPSQPDSSAPTLSGVPRAADPPPAPLNPGVSPDKKFPFPGEGAPSSNAGSDPSASSSSSSSAGSAGDEPNPADAASRPDAGTAPELKDKGSEGQQTLPGRHILHRVNPQGTKLQSPEAREAEDLDVARSYVDQENFAAAYMRSLDAVKIQPDDPAAHLLLAEVAMKLNKRDEAIDHYQQCLKLDPLDKQAKAARKGLARLQVQR